MRTELASFYVFGRYFCCSKSSEQTHKKKQNANVILTRVLQEPGQRTIPSVLMHDEKGVLLQNIVGAEYIVCTHWLNIVGATAPTAPMVPTPMKCVVPT